MPVHKRCVVEEVCLWNESKHNNNYTYKVLQDHQLEAQVGQKLLTWIRLLHCGMVAILAIRADKQSRI